MQGCYQQEGMGSIWPYDSGIDRLSNSPYVLLWKSTRLGSKCYALGMEHLEVLFLQYSVHELFAIALQGRRAASSVVAPVVSSLSTATGSPRVK